MDTNSHDQAKQENISNNTSVTENGNQSTKGYPMAEDTCMYSKPLPNEEARFFPPPISCLRVFDKGKPLVYSKLDKNTGRNSRKKIIVPRGTMSCLRHNGRLKMWFPRIAREEEQEQEQQQPDGEGDNPDDDDSDSSEYYIESDEESDDDDDSDDSDEYNRSHGDYNGNVVQDDNNDDEDDN